MRLADKVAIVTGAAHGIGRAIAERFIHEGAFVYIADIDDPAGQEVARASESSPHASRGRAIFVRCDVSSVSDVGRLKQTAEKQKGRVDILCNNAAFISEKWHAAGDAPQEEWENSWRVSLLGAQHCIQALLPLMTARKTGSIINVSSVQGLVAGRNSAAYTTVKHALIGLTRSVACDYGHANIRCNALCPGAITTRISPPAGSELHERQIKKTFLGRIGAPREVADAALFLASDESSYITGAVLAVDGGWTAI